MVIGRNSKPHAGRLPARRLEIPACLAESPRPIRSFSEEPEQDRSVLSGVGCQSATNLSGGFRHRLVLRSRFSRLSWSTVPVPAIELGFGSLPSFSGHAHGPDSEAL